MRSSGVRTSKNHKQVLVRKTTLRLVRFYEPNDHLEISKRLSTHKSCLEGGSVEES